MKVRVAFANAVLGGLEYADKFCERDIYLYGSGENADGLDYYTLDKCGRVENTAKGCVSYGDYVANADGKVVGIVIDTYKHKEKVETKDAESILCELLANRYPKEIHTPFFNLLKWAVLEYTGHRAIFEAVRIDSIVLVDNKGKKLLWFKDTTSWTSSVETFWKIKMPYISVDYVLSKSPVVHYYNGESVSDIKEISEDFIKISKLFLEKLGGGQC